MKVKFDDFIDVLKVLIRAPSVTGSEHSFYRVLQRELEERGAKVSWYEGLLVAQGSQPDSAMFSAHIDRHGLVCTGPDEFQYAAFVAGSRSDLLGNSVSEQLINKIVDRYIDAEVIAYEPWSGAYLGRGKIDKTYICEYRNNLIFELDGLNHLLAGTPVAFTDKLEINQGYLSSQLDNVLSAAALVHLFSLGFEGTAFFTAQEEAGKSWRYLLEWFRRFGQSANNLIVVDTSPYPDTQTADQQKVVLRRRDANAFFDAQMSAKIESICQKHHISYSYKDDFITEKNKQLAQTHSELLSYGSTEMGRIIQASKGMVTGTTIQIPTTGYHTMEETASVESIKSFLTVLIEIAKIPVPN
mgnify:CR=1 FL=1